MLILIILCIFTSVALTCGAILYPLLIKRTMFRERLDKMMPENAAIPETFTNKKSTWKKLFESFGKRIPVAGNEQSKYTRMLVAAGLKKESLYMFLGCKLLLAFAIPGFYMLSYAIPLGVFKQTDTLLFVIALAIIGYLLPSFWLTHRVKSRKREIFHTLPDILDLLTISVEAGLGIDASLNRTADSQQFHGNPLAEEIKLAASEIRAGKPRAQALNDMAERTMEEDLKSFITMLVQTERFGTSLSMALRVHSDSLRTKRRQIAEELAAKTAIKILFPLILFVFPALMIVLVGPAFVRLMDIFK